MGEAKPSAKTSALVPQPHGGALLPGAGGGPQPGGGRPPSWFREEARRLLLEKPTVNGKRRTRLEFAARVLDGDFPEATVADRLKAWKELVAIGVPNRVEHTGANGEAVRFVLDIPRPEPYVPQLPAGDEDDG
jgi:hypothetical protein